MSPRSVEAGFSSLHRLCACGTQRDVSSEEAASFSHPVVLEETPGSSACLSWVERVPAPPSLVRRGIEPMHERRPATLLPSVRGVLVRSIWGVSSRLLRSHGEPCDVGTKSLEPRLLSCRGRPGT
eukprot:4029870-Pleurochrysis_carterae.AAC.1